MYYYTLYGYLVTTQKALSDTRTLAVYSEL